MGKVLLIIKAERQPRVLPFAILRAGFRRAGDLRRRVRVVARELKGLEAEHPEQESPDSPRQRVGVVTMDALPKHVHHRPMPSLANVFNAGELIAARFAPR